jgi:glucosamine--fructose-6-phosphate aminotransferase (isomerizing)
LEEIEKAGYPYFMLKEIMDQPSTLRNAMLGRVIKNDAIETLAGTPVEEEHAGEFRYSRPILCRGDVLVAISQSGETADTLEAIRIGKEFNALTIGIVNGVGSSIERLTDAGVYLYIGPEMA